MKYFVLIIFMAAITSCGDIINSVGNQNILGKWNLVSITDVSTGKVTDVLTSSTTTRILGNNLGNAISFENDLFNIYNQVDGDVGQKDGSYVLDFTKLTLNFDNKTVLKTSVNSVSESELILADTVNLKARTLTFVR